MWQGKNERIECVLVLKLESSSASCEMKDKTNDAMDVTWYRSQEARKEWLVRELLTLKAYWTKITESMDDISQ